MPTFVYYNLIAYSLGTGHTIKNHMGRSDKVGGWPAIIKITIVAEIFG